MISPLQLADSPKQRVCPEVGGCVGLTVENILHVLGEQGATSSTTNKLDMW